MTTEEIAEKFSRVSGYKLVNYYQAALPLWIITFDATVIARKQIPLVDEFILRAIHEGLTTVEEVAGFLGLNEKYIIKCLGRLVSDDTVHSSDNWISLTQRGSALLDQSKQTQPRREEISILYDGISRTPIVSGADWSPITGQQVRQWGLFEVPALPGKSPTEADLDAIDFNRALPRVAKEKAEIDQVLSATKSGHMRKRFREAIMLIYQGRTEEDILVRFISLDARPIEAVNKAFANKRGIKRLHIIEGLKQSRLEVKKELKEDPDSDLVQRIQTEAESNEQKESKAVDEIQKVIDKQAALHAKSKDDEGIEKLKKQVEDLVAERDSEARKQKSASIRYIDSFEHVSIFKNALTSAKTRLLVVSPWITDRVMDRAKMKLLEERLKAGVDVYIGYGITKRPGDAPDTRGDYAINSIRALAKRHKNLRFVKLGNTHAKALVFDDCAAIGSFNWMSFGGKDSDGKGRSLVREELSYLVQDVAKSDEIFNRFLKRFEKFYAKTKPNQNKLSR
jgi:phosphatidylserine/phosphatidylglycerophosphate/cardiolipin synthase-like enzyme